MATEQRGIRLLVCNRVAEQIWQYRNCDSEQREIHRRLWESENKRAFIGMKEGNHGGKDKEADV